MKRTLPIFCSLSLAIGLSSYYLLTNGENIGLPTLTSVSAVKTIVLSEIRPQMKLVSAEQNANTLLSGFTQSIVPLSKDEINYWAVFKAQATIDLKALKDRDLIQNGRTVFIKLPRPELEVNLDLEHSKVVSRESQILSGPFQNADLITEIQRQAKDKIKNELTASGKLQSEATMNAQTELKTLFAQFGIEVVFGDFVGPVPKPEKN